MKRVWLKSFVAAAFIALVATVIAISTGLITRPPCDYKVNTTPGFVQGVPCSVTDELTYSSQIKILAGTVFIATFAVILSYLYIKRRKKDSARKNSTTTIRK